MAGAELRVLVPLDGSPLEKEARAVLSAVPDVVWSRSEDGALLQARFSADIGEALHEQLRRLVAAGVGTHARSVISVWPTSLLLHGTRGGGSGSTSVRGSRSGSTASGNDFVPCSSPPATSSAKAPGAGVAGKTGAAEEEILANEDDAATCDWYDFLGSAAERLAMARAVQAAEADARLSFDYVCLLFIAAFLAALGLVENSTEILVASMLISPLMGPIMAFTLGTLARERRLQSRGVRVELLGLAGCLLLGFLFGLTMAGASGGVPAQWPTHEMTTRGRLHAIWVGALVALLSGAAIALATLGGYTASLVGVAISAALLPPAVNAGLLWSIACATLLPPRDDNAAADAVEASSPITPSTPEDPREVRLLSPGDLALQGGLSFCLTLLNIICIYLAAVVVLKMKRVTAGPQDHLLSPEDLRWTVQERTAQSPVHHHFWPPKHGKHGTLGRRSSLFLPTRASASDLHTGYDSNLRTWSPGAGGPRPSLNELRNIYRWTHGAAAYASTSTAESTHPLMAAAPSPVTFVPTNQSSPPAATRLQSTQSPPFTDSRSPNLRVITSAVTLPTISEARLSPSPPHPNAPRRLPEGSVVAPRFVVTPARDPLLDSA